MKVDDSGNLAEGFVLMRWNSPHWHSGRARSYPPNADAGTGAVRDEFLWTSERAQGCYTSYAEEKFRAYNDTDGNKCVLFVHILRSC